MKEHEKVSEWAEINMRIREREQRRKSLIETMISTFVVSTFVIGGLLRSPNRGNQIPLA